MKNYFYYRGQKIYQIDKSIIEVDLYFINVKEKKFYTKEQPVTFFKYLDEHIAKDGRTGLKILAFFRVLAFTGLRKSEVLSLQWKVIGFEESSPNISKTLAVDKFGKIVIQSLIIETEKDLF